MAEFTLPLTAEGAVTAPTGSFVFTEPSAESETFLDVGSANVLKLPEFGWAVADGVNPLRFITRGSVYDAGGIAPSVAPTVAGTGTRATAVGTYTGQPGDTDSILLGKSGESQTVAFKTTLVTDGTEGHQVKIGVDADTTYANLLALINGTGTQGTEYFNVLTYLGFEDDFSEVIKIECSAQDTGAGTITMRYVEYGTTGNAALSTEVVAVANFAWAAGTFSGGTDGTGTEPAAGTYRYFYTWYREADGAETGRSPIASVTKATNENTALTVLTASADTTFDYTRVYRTTQSGVEFRLVGAVPRATTTLTDSVSDEVLGRSLIWNEVEHRAYAEGQLPRGLALVLWKGALWTVGAHLHADYTRGTAAVTKDSAAVTFSVKGVTTRMVGRTLVVDSTSEEYTVISVAEGGPTCVLDRAYEGTTNGTASFRIKDAYDAARLRRSVTGLYNQWPVEESPGRVDTDDSRGGTALLSTEHRMFGFSPTSIMSVTGDGIDSWDVNRISADVGCASQRMLVAVEGGGMFLAEDAFYAISPDETLVSISSPKTRKGEHAQGLDGTVARINQGAVDQGYSIYDKENRVVIFGVPLDGDLTPNHEIVFDLQNGTWTTYRRAGWTTAAKVTLPGGAIEILAGDREGHLWHVDTGESDGFYGTEAVQTLTGAQTVRVLTVSGTPYSTDGDGESGKPVIVLYADGETVAYGKVASNTTSALTLTEDLDAAPAASDQVILGGIAWQAKSGYPTFGEEYDEKRLRSVTLRHHPSTRGEYHFSFAVDGGSFRVCPVGTSIGTLSQANGKTTHKVQWPGDSHAINLRGFKPGGQAVIRGGIFDLLVRKRGTL